MPFSSRWLVRLAIFAVGLGLGGCRHDQAPPVKAVVVVGQQPTGHVETPVASPPVSPGPHAVRKLAGSPGHTCALLFSGKVACWGSGLGPIDKRGYHTNLKRPTFVKGIDDAIDVSTGNYHACAARASGKVVCWGSNSDGELGDPERHIWREHDTLVDVQNASDVVALAGRATHTCARLRSGRVSCWGKNVEGQLGSRAGQEVIGAIEVPGVEDVVELAVMHTESCARLGNGKVMCWGGTNYPGMNRNVAPHVIEGIDDAVSLATDESQACVTRSNGSLVCVATLNNSKKEIKLPDPKEQATHAAVGAGFACAVTASGKVACLGSNHSGELGDGTVESREVASRFVVDLEDATQVVASWNHLCALRKSGDVVCWGANDSGQLGIGTDDVELPFLVPNVAASKIVVGPESSCALANETVKCWGHDFTRSQYAARSEPSMVPNVERDIVDIALGRWHACAIKKGGAVVCWGNPSTLGAQLPYRDDSSAKPIANIANDAVAITTGENHTCVRRKNGRVACWGQNQKGALGDGTMQPSLAAVDVKGLTDAVEVSAGADHTCARRTNGSIVCWGANDSGQLGAFAASGDPSPSSNVPIAVPGLKPAVSIGAGASHTCALAADGKVTCWGSEHRGNIVCSHPGGCKGQRFIEVPDLSAKTLVVGGRLSCALDASKVAKCWSRVTALDTDLKSVASLPAPVDALAIESSHSCALLPKPASTPNVMCWGRNEAGQVGAPPPYRTKPVAVLW